MYHEIYRERPNAAEAVARFLSDPKVHEHWMDYALQEQPGDRYRAECAIRYLYLQVGLEAPVIVWRDTPFHGAVAALHLSFGVNLLDLEKDEKPKNAGFLSLAELPSGMDHWQAEEALKSPWRAISHGLMGLLQRRWENLRTPDVFGYDTLDGCSSIQGSPAYSEIAKAGRDLLHPPPPSPAVMNAAGFGHDTGPSAFPRQPRQGAERGPNRNEDKPLVTTPIEWANRVHASVQETFGLREIDCKRLVLRHCPGDSQSYYIPRMCAVLNRAFRGPQAFWEDLAASWTDAPVECAGLTKAWMDARDSVGTFWVFKDFCVATPVPRIRLDERKRLHCETGPAVRYSEESAHYYLHGVSVPEKFVLHPEGVTAKEIDSQWNVEVRRTLIERYGQELYLWETGAQIIHQDDFGVLYHKYVQDGEPLVMVKVVNATPEPDGSFKDYFLRVPPDMQTARQAVAWTFGKTESEYDPDQES
jgi:hypothetical protein